MSKAKLNLNPIDTTTTTWGTTQSVSYSKYSLKNYKFDFKQLEEQKIFKEFEELGYEIERIGMAIYLRNKELDVEITIWLRNKIYTCTLYKRVMAQLINLKEHQLLHKLFELWGWFDE